MKTYPIITEIESGYNLYNCDNVNLNFKFENSNRVLVKGLVTNPNNHPIADVAVTIFQIDHIIVNNISRDNLQVNESDIIFDGVSYILVNIVSK